MFAHKSLSLSLSETGATGEVNTSDRGKQSERERETVCIPTRDSIARDTLASDTRPSPSSPAVTVTYKAIEREDVCVTPRSQS